LLILVLAESALETIPESLWTSASIRRYAKVRRKHPRFVLLDRSYHHAAMKRLASSEKHGRPDILHFALLEALGSPLSKEGFLQVYVHTINDYVIKVNPDTRLPRNCNRFVSLIEQLFEFGQIPPMPPEKPLLVLKKQTLEHLMDEIQPSHILALSKIGRPQTIEDTVSKLIQQKKLAVLVGGFPKGHFSESTAKLPNEVVRIDKETLETWIVVSRVIYEFERALSLPRKRLEE
jgi:rRNA small subunit pseudouridine methyltransferase Nep1